MKLPRDLSGAEGVRGLRRVGYQQTRQVGDHVYMTTLENGGTSCLRAPAQSAEGVDAGGDAWCSCRAFGIESRAIAPTDEGLKHL